MSILDTIIDKIANPCVTFFSMLLKLMGPLLVLAFYGLVGLHVYCFFFVEAWILKARVGTPMGILWIAIGLCLLYNLVFNHFMAWFIRPMGPKDLKRIEELRFAEKQREGRKQIYNDNLTDKERI